MRFRRVLCRHLYIIFILSFIAIIWINRFHFSDLLDSLRYSAGNYMQDVDVVNYQEFEINKTATGSHPSNKTAYNAGQNLTRDINTNHGDNVFNGLESTIASNKYNYTSPEIKYLPTELGKNVTYHNYSRQNLYTGSVNCSADIYSNNPAPTSPYKVYIYNLPLAFNADLIQCVADKRVASNDHCGFGPLLYEEGRPADMSVRNTWQFSLDVIFHHKLMLSPYRTRDPEEADVFYIPFYEALHCFCKGRGAGSSKNLTYNGLHYERAVYEEVLRRLPYYDAERRRRRRPHVITVAKIEREERSKRCRLLSEPWLKDNVLLLGIEAYDKHRHLRQLHQPVTPFLPFTSVPYPSYGHFLHSGDAGNYRKKTLEKKRKVLIFLAASTRRSNPFRNHILDQMTNRTHLSMSQFYSTQALPDDTILQQMWFLTPENAGPHQEATMKWMRNSLFCLQPAGDSPTRKSFFDAILSGCVPVLFKIPYDPHVTYPFQNVIDYSKFTVTVGENETFMGVLKPYLDNLLLVQPLQRYLDKVMQYFQYSYPIDNKPHTDAVKLILDQIGLHFGLQKNITSFMDL